MLCVLQIVADLEKGLADKGIKAKVIYSGGADVDVLAAKASKGAGLQFLLRQVLCVVLSRTRKPP